MYRNLVLAVILLLCSRAVAADIYLFAGQSNMWGTGVEAKDLPPDLAAVDENIRILDLTDNAAPGASVPLQNGVNNNWDKGSWGCEASLMHKLAAAAAEKPIYLLKFSAGGSWLAQRPDTEQNDWNPDSKGEYLDKFLDQVAKAKHSLEAAGKKAEFKGFIWMQGESDCNDSSAANAYEANLNKLIERVRTTADAPDMPVYLGRIQRQYSGKFLHTVRAAQARVAAGGKAITLVDTDAVALRDDKIHYTAEGQIVIGEAVYDLMTGKTKPAPAEVKVDQAFTVREAAGPGTIAGKVLLSNTPSPSPTFTVDSAAFTIEPETGVLRVANLAGIDYARTPTIKVNVAAVNGASPTGTAEVTVRFEHADVDEAHLAGRWLTIDPGEAADVTVADNAYTELHDRAETARKYTGEHPPLQDTFIGGTKKAMVFDGTNVLVGPSSKDVLTPGVDEDLTVALVCLPSAKKTEGVGWAAVINKSVVEPALAIGYDYAAQKFVFVYANSFNGAIQTVSTEAKFDPDKAYIVRLRKAGDSCQLFVDGVVAAEVKGEGVRRPILAENEGAPMGLGGMFPPSPSYAGYLGKMLIIKAVPTTTEEAWIDKHLAAWAGRKTE